MLHKSIVTAHKLAVHRVSEAKQMRDTANEQAGLGQCCVVCEWILLSEQSLFVIGYDSAGSDLLFVDLKEF